jgi:O-antigen biosynthesis protein WbqP
LKRIFDLLLALVAAVVLVVPVLMAVRLTTAGLVRYWFDRAGRHNKLFKMPKFCSMQLGTPVVATHLLADSKAHLTQAQLRRVASAVKHSGQQHEFCGAAPCNV